MVFCSLVFLCMFLPLTVLIYYIIKPLKWKNFFLLVASILFYSWGGSANVILLLGVSLWNYLLGLLIDRCSVYRKIILILGIIANLFILGYYKYWNFLEANIESLFGVKISIAETILPIGISFYVFQGLSYLIDVYRCISNGNNENVEKDIVQKNPINVLLYISLFPQLVAGPIVRYKDISKQIIDRKHSVNDFSKGLERFINGLAKKIIIADAMGSVADQIFALENGMLAPHIAWIGAICYLLQIYFDFLGYSDMAIGLAEIFGFSFQENFRFPYISCSITEFWRRWHISLSSWFRDYVYIPMGGSRKGNVYIHLFVTFLLTGIWHGAEWTFLLWGIWHGTFIILERVAQKHIHINTSKLMILKWCYTMFVVIVGWVLFRADSLVAARDYLNAMFGQAPLYFQPFKWRYYLDNKTLFLMVTAILLSLLPVDKLINRLRKNISGLVAIKITNICLLLICLVTLIHGAYSPFIYFRF